jgi:hypothetical protein
VTEPTGEQLHRCAGRERHVWLDPRDAARCCAGYARVVRAARDATGNVVPRYEWQPIARARVSSERTATERAATDAAVIDAVLAEADTFARTSKTPGVDAARFWPACEHRAFFQALARLEPETPRWYAVRAGWLGLRLVDEFGARHFTGRTPSFASFKAARAAAEMMPGGSQQRMLLAIADAVREYSPERGPSVQALLLHYGARHEADREFRLALDVYGVVARLARTVGQQEQLGECLLRIGDCWRRLGRRAAAVEARRVGRAAMRAVGSVEGELRIRIGEARDAAHWGDVAGAVAQLETLGRDARALRAGEVRATVAHELGNLLARVGETERCLRSGFGKRGGLPMSS